MENIIRKVIEFNKINLVTEEEDNNYRKLFNDINKNIEDFKIIDSKISSIIACIVSNFQFKNIAENVNILIRYNNNLKISHEQDIEVSLLKWQLDNIIKKFSYKNIKIIIFFNITETEISSKYLKFNNNADNKIDCDSAIFNVHPIEPRYKMSNLILDKRTLEELGKTITMIKNIDKIYDEWEFIKIDPIKKCVINLFGPPGTGKTMASHAISNELGLRILALNYADIESKYVGDAPKNLVAAFDIAKNENAVLFFDEADSFLGKRITNVTQGHEQALNSLRSQLLILLESFDGIVIFATNLHKNYDTAFDSRILKHIEFKLPNRETRASIIKNMIPDKAPINKELFTDEYLLELSDIIEGFSPREIKNTILELLISHLHLNKEIDKEFIKNTFENSKASFEQIKKDNVISREAKVKLEENIKKNFENNNYITDKLEN